MNCACGIFATLHWILHWIGYVAIVLYNLWYFMQIFFFTICCHHSQQYQYLHCYSTLKYLFQIKVVVLALLCFTVLLHQSHGLGFQNIICRDRCRYRFKQCLDLCVEKNDLEKDFSGGYEECMNLCSQLLLLPCSCP